MNTLLIVVTVSVFGAVAYFLGRLPSPMANFVKLAISFPAMIYFASIALSQPADRRWGTWLFVIVALGIFVKAVRDVLKARNGDDRLDQSH